MRRKPIGQGILAFDIGGSGIKAAVINDRGRMISPRHRVLTPKRSTPTAVLRAMRTAAKSLKGYNRVAVGFPGLVREGIVYTAPNLGNTAWYKFPLAERLEKIFKAPVRLLNDAEMQGLSVIEGKGMELTVTLGTGFGIAIFYKGRPIPHLELSQHPVHRGMNYDMYLGNKTRKKIGKKKWSRRLIKALTVLKVVVAYNRIYVGGGNAKKIKGPLPRGARVVENRAGLLGGARLWQL